MGGGSGWGVLSGLGLLLCCCVFIVALFVPLVVCLVVLLSVASLCRYE